MGNFLRLPRPPAAPQAVRSSQAARRDEYGPWNRGSSKNIAAGERDLPAADEAAKEAVIEAALTGPSEPEVTHQALQQRLRQQEILAELGVLALRGVPFP
ncbi:MAG: hypothetical protein U1E17_05155 [Geminicoccaceae bacterium]